MSLPRAYNSPSIKNGARAPANLPARQGGSPFRRMRPGSGQRRSITWPFKQFRLRTCSGVCRPSLVCPGACRSGRRTRRRRSVRYSCPTSCRRTCYSGPWSGARSSARRRAGRRAGSAMCRRRTSTRNTIEASDSLDLRQVWRGIDGGYSNTRRRMTSGARSSCCTCRSRRAGTRYG